MSGPFVACAPPLGIGPQAIGVEMRPLAKRGPCRPEYVSFSAGGPSRLEKMPQARWAFTSISQLEHISLTILESGEHAWTATSWMGWRLRDATLRQPQSMLCPDMEYHTSAWLPCIAQFSGHQSPEV